MAKLREMWDNGYKMQWQWQLQRQLQLQLQLQWQDGGGKMLQIRKISYNLYGKT